METAEGLLPRAHVRVRRIDLRVAVGVLLMLVAIFEGASLIRSAQARTPVLVAAASVQPDVIKPSEVRVVAMSVARGVAYLPASMQSQIVGRVATEPFWEGKLLGPLSVSESPPLPAGTVAMSLMLKADRAVAGGLRPGDNVAVIASTAPGRGEPQTTILFTSVPVLAVSREAPEDGGGYTITLRLRLEEARTLAAARSAGSVDLALLSGSKS